MRQRDPILPRRVLMALAGMALTGVSVGFFKRAMLGVDPYQCFAGGIANVVPLGFGTTYMLVNLIQLAVVFFLDRRYIGISTFINLFLLGYMVEFSENLLARWFGDLAVPGRILFFAIAILLTCVAAALYYSADLGVSTYDAIPLHIADGRPKLAGRVLPFRAVRIISDLICVLIGLLLGVKPGVGTVITALFMGPLISYFRRVLTDPLVARSAASGQ